MWLGGTTSPAHLTPPRPSEIMQALPQTVQRKLMQGHDPRHCRAVLHALSALQIHRFQKGRRPKFHRGGFSLAPSTLLLLSLRSPLFPIPMASSHRGHGVRATVSAEGRPPGLPPAASAPGPQQLLGPPVPRDSRLLGAFGSEEKIAWSERWECVVIRDSWSR